MLSKRQMAARLASFSTAHAKPLGAWLLLSAFAGCQPAVIQRQSMRSRPTPGATNNSPGAMPTAGTDPSGTPVTPDTPTTSPSVPPPPPPLTAAAISCPAGQMDPPSARRVMRLQASELLAALGTVTPIPQGAVPAGFDTTKLGELPDPTLSVSRSFYDDATRVATALAQSISANPVGLGCAVSEFGTNASCTSAFVTQLAGRFFRGAVAADDGATLTALAQKLAGQSDGKSALETVVSVMALSPKSLYLVEGIDRTVPAATPAPLSAAEMASYLSFRIAKTAPTPELIAALSANYPPTADQVNAALSQLFAPEALQRGATDFVASWLKLGAIPSLIKEPTKHPEATPAYMGNLQTETYDALTQTVASGNGDLAQLLTGEMRSTLLGDAANPLIATYGRPGVLALPGFIAVISANNHTDIPRRGRFLVTSLFCEAVPSPPPNATSMQPPVAASASERQKFERIEMEGTCGPCHQRVNHLAFAFERYDEIGQVREFDEKNNPIDTASTHTFTDGQAPFVFSNAKELGALAAQNPLAQTCLSLQAFQYVTRRDAGQGRDDCAVSSIVSEAQKASFKLTDLFRGSLVRTALAPRAD